MSLLRNLSVLNRKIPEKAAPYLPAPGTLVPIANIGSGAAIPLFMLGLIFSWQPLVEIGILCFALAANQEYVIKYAYASRTCVVSARVRRAGLRNAMRVWLAAVGMFLPAAGLMTFAVTGIRMLALSGEGAPPAKLFTFPFAGAWGLNAVLFGFGLLCLVFGAGVLLYRFAHDPAKTRAMLAVLSAWLYEFFGLADCNDLLNALFFRVRSEQRHRFP